MSDSEQIKVLIVCLGNICRSPMGEAVLQHIAKERGLDISVDSAGTAAYHVGEEADSRTIDVCNKHGIQVLSRARKIKSTDYTTFNYILAADTNNLRDLEKMKPHGATAHVCLWGSYLGGQTIPDPYYGGIDGFEKSYKLCTELSIAFLGSLVEQPPT